MTSANIDITLSDPVNLRDLGGIPIAGGALREGVAIRSDDLAYVTPESAEALVGNGLTAIIDLRSPLEVSLTGRGPLAGYPISYHHLPLIGDLGSETPRADDLTHEAMGRMYVRMVDQAASQLVTALNIIAYTPGAAAFHCAAGRDRTGVLAAVLLLALGTPDDEIVRDYVRTHENMPAILERGKPVMGAMWKALGLDPQMLEFDGILEGSMAVSMEMLLGALRSTHGDPLAPLRAAGLSDATLTRLRDKARGQ